ncbi:hypothetical protein KY284_013151 [Solanum tuberosum]|nr:hypothetical protein KY284_013151 [Solanum tuberosum]
MRFELMSPVWSPTPQSSLMAEPLPRQIVPCFTAPVFVARSEVKTVVKNRERVETKGTLSRRFARSFLVAYYLDCSYFIFFFQALLRKHSLSYLRNLKSLSTPRILYVSRSARRKGPLPLEPYAGELACAVLRVLKECFPEDGKGENALIASLSYSLAKA